jgi:hypothetical protein
MAYMFVHDGLVHKRFPVGPIANVPYFRTVAAAHTVPIHQSSKQIYIFFNLFLQQNLTVKISLDFDVLLQLHHSDKFDGVPYGLFLGPKVRLGFFFKLKKKKTVSFFLCKLCLLQWQLVSEFCAKLWCRNWKKWEGWKSWKRR